jgi:hypothetical protein
MCWKKSTIVDVKRYFGLSEREHQPRDKGESEKQEWQDIHADVTESLVGSMTREKQQDFSHKVL